MEMKLEDRLTNPTKLQKKIIQAIKGFEVGEVVHAFEVLKIAMLFADESYNHKK